MQRTIQTLGWTLIWSSLFIFGYLGWQLIGTDLVNAGVQAESSRELEAYLEESPPPQPEEVDAGDASPQETVPFFRETAPPPGEEMAFLRIPAIGAEDVVFHGVDVETLRKGPGHMEGTPLPGQPGNSVISGHRTTYGRPFFDFDLLEPGHRIEVETSIGTHVYEVREILVVQPTDVWVTDPRPGAWLTLTTCEPKFSARQRLVVSAEMVEGPNLEFVELGSRTSSG